MFAKDRSSERPCKWGSATGRGEEKIKHETEHERDTNRGGAETETEREYEKET